VLVHPTVVANLSIAAKADEGNNTKLTCASDDCQTLNASAILLPQIKDGDIADSVQLKEADKEICEPETPPKIVVQHKVVDTTDEVTVECNKLSALPDISSKIVLGTESYSVTLRPNGDFSIDKGEGSHSHGTGCNHHYDDGKYAIDVNDRNENEENDDIDLDLDVKCTDHDNVLSSVLPEDYEEGYNIMMVQSDGKDTVFESGVKVTSRNGEVRVFIHALKPQLKYGENIIPVFITENDFEKWLAQKGKCEAS
jgi:hypothetical protein